MPANLSSALATILIGWLFVAIGAVSIAAGLAARPRRAPIAVWFGLFTALYGVRLASRSALLPLVTGWPPIAFGYADAMITYTILVPAGLFTESLVGRGTHGVVRRAWQLTVLCAVGAIAHDIVRRQPGATMWVNPPVVFAAVSVFVWQTFSQTRASRPWSADALAVAATGVLFTLVAFYETVFLRAPFGIPFNLEPFAMLAVTGAIGWFVLRRVGSQAEEFSALSRELDLAREIQQSLLPRQMPEVAGVRLTGTCLPMSTVAGDFYDVATGPSGETVVIVADVSGHGVPAALIASMVKVAFAAEVERYADPGEILGGINRSLTGKFDRAFVTACVVTVAPWSDTLACAAAGHPPPMLLRCDGTVTRIACGGVALALTLLPLSPYETARLLFAPGDRLLLYTDGLLEASRPDGGDEFFGDHELERVVSSVRPADDLAAIILAAHGRWIGPAPLADDVTLVLVERVGSAPV